MWDDWEEMRLRKVFDGVVGQCGGSGMEELKREFKTQLDMIEISVKPVERWPKGLDEDRLLAPKHPRLCVPQCCSVDGVIQPNPALRGHACRGHVNF